MTLKQQFKKNKIIHSTYNEFKKLKTSAEIEITNFALDAKLKSGHTNYTKYIILSRGRSGTNFLRGMLNSNYQSICFGEIFRDFGSIGWDLPGYRKGAKRLNLIQNEPEQFLEKYVFRTYPEIIKSIGFKLFYYHAQNPEWKSIWSYLQQAKDLHVIHLKRENMLATYLSTCRAHKTKVWENKSNKLERNEPMILEYEGCLEFFEKTKEFEIQTDDFFKGSKKLDISYEDLSENTNEEMKRVQSFLGMDYSPIKSRNYKQSVTPLSEGIKNYAELKAKFGHTPWSGLFEVQTE